MTNASTLGLLSHLAMFVPAAFLLCGAIVVPHDQKHGGKAVLVTAALLIGWRATTLHGGASETFDVALAGVLLIYRRAVWAWMLRTLSRERRHHSSPVPFDRRASSQRVTK